MVALFGDFLFRDFLNEPSQPRGILSYPVRIVDGVIIYFPRGAFYKACFVGKKFLKGF